jgi:hypothetical protein
VRVDGGFFVSDDEGDHIVVEDSNDWAWIYLSLDSCTMLLLGKNEIFYYCVVRAGVSVF